MFTRQTPIRLKVTPATEFARMIENEILPLLREQKSFPDGIIRVTPAPSALKVTEGIPKVETFELSQPMIHNVVTKAA
jgi:hypothetical protein